MRWYNRRGSHSWPVPGAGFKPVGRYFVSQVGSTPTGFRQFGLTSGNKFLLPKFRLYSCQRPGYIRIVRIMWMRIISTGAVFAIAGFASEGPDAASQNLTRPPVLRGSEPTDSGVLILPA